MKQFKFKINGGIYEVSVEEKDRNSAEVKINGKTVIVEVAEETNVRKPIKRKERTHDNVTTTASPMPPRPTGGANAIKAPMPGSIFKIEVTVGQTVKKGDVLLVMESMKMENNIMAGKDGVVKAIHVQLGQSVLQGDALIDIE